jgi:hypothetical protein
MSDIDMTPVEDEATEGELPEAGDGVVEEPEAPTIEVKVQEAIFMEDCVKVILTGGVEKLITYEAFVGILKNITNIIDEKMTDEFLMPSNVFYFAKSHDAIQISCYYTSRVCDLMYYDSKFKIMTPNIIVSHVLHRQGEDKKWQVETSNYFCTDVPVGNLPKTFINRLDHNNRIWLLPMSNTYDGGNMCYGSNVMPRNFVDNNLRALDWYYNYLWNSPFNDDLGIRAVSGDYGSVNTWYKDLKVLAEKGEPFPYHRLRGYTAR